MLYLSVVSNGGVRGVADLRPYPAVSFVVGDSIVVRYNFQSHTLSSMDAQDLTIQSIKIYTSWAMGFAATRTRRSNIIDYHVLPRGGRWMSTIVDCLLLPIP